MPIKLIQKYCYGCGFATKINNYYEGDSHTPWCDDCFVSEETLARIQASMPFCRKPIKIKNIKIVAFLPFPV